MTLQFNSVMLEQTLAAVPLFVFMGIMMEQAGLMERLFRSVQLMLASTRGSLYIAVLFVSTIFAAATGIVGASVTILGIMAAKTMNRSGYDVRLAAGTITAGGTLGILIPPSIMLVVLGPVLEVPVTDLFAAAIVPGLLLAFLYTAYSLVRCWLNPELGPPLPKEEASGELRHRGPRVHAGARAPRRPRRLRARIDPVRLGDPDGRGRLRGVRRPPAYRRLREAEPRSASRTRSSRRSRSRSSSCSWSRPRTSSGRFSRASARPAC